MHPAILIYRLVQNVFVIIAIIPAIIHNFISFFSAEKNKTMRSATIINCILNAQFSFMLFALLCYKVYIRDKVKKHIHKIL